MKKNKLEKIIVILGPTASGKTDLGIFLAKKFRGEIISADSRQIYKGMNIGTAKPPFLKKEEGGKLKDFVSIEGIPHYMIDIIEPDEEFSLSDFKKQAIKYIEDVLDRKKLPIIVGGTGLYIQSIVDNLDIPKVAPNIKLRTKLEKKTLLEQVEELKKCDPKSAEKIDLKNPRRVLRALEVFKITGKSFFKQQTKSNPIYDVLQIGIKCNREVLNERISKRVDMQIKDGLVDEVKKLVKRFGNDIWKFPSMSGIGYKQIGYFLKNEKSLDESVEVLKRDTRRYAKRQMTWFKRNKNIKWILREEREKAIKLVSEFNNF